MQYRIDKKNYHTFEIFEVNKLAPRSYFIPFSTKEKADEATIATKRYTSDRVVCLNGDWDFKFYPLPKEVPDVLDTDATGFDSIDVPACWQFRGYDKPFYINAKNQFNYDPPHIPTEGPVGAYFWVQDAGANLVPHWEYIKDSYNFVGIYRKKFTVSGQKQRIISFLGVASCLDLYVNGQFVGYSEGAHNTAEFDLTEFIREGENELVAVVHRWCNSTYIECQDMLRNNGIFRDVLLREMEEADFWDISFRTEKTENGYTAKISAELTAEAEVKVTLCGHGLEKTATARGEDIAVAFEDLQVKEWTAETPDLYDLYLELPSSCVKLRVGFKHITIEGDLFKLNGKLLKFKGVNHHDTSCTNGYTMTPAEIERDVRLCKEHNIDTIRTSHYPPDPQLIEWCDQLGVYVVDEADIEAHASLNQQISKEYGHLSHDPAWEDHYVDRIQRLFYRDQNCASIVMWSMGNEAGGHRNFDVAYEWLKTVTDIPVHYESVYHSPRQAYDVASHMYPSYDTVQQIANKTYALERFNDRPYFLCEYVHAMGVGPGAMETYWEMFYKYDALIGGCIWEMVDHAVLHEDGSYTYGGDHGEYIHDKHFCVDGIFYPDRTPSTGAKIARHVYRPIRVRHVEGNKYEIFNTLSFTDASRYALHFGELVVRESVAPLSRKVVELPVKPEGLVTVVAIDTASGKEVSREQLVFDLPMKTAPESTLTLDKEALKEGCVVLHKDGKTITAAPQYTILYRAATDNDRAFKGESMVVNYAVQREFMRRVDAENLTVETEIVCRRQKFLCTDTYEVCPQGVKVTSKLLCTEGEANLPRFGKAYRLEESFDDVVYTGRGGESYCDMYDHEQIDTYKSKVCAMTEPNIKPQESGSRYQTTQAAVSDGETSVTFTAVEKPFELGIKPYTDWELCFMKHREDEIRTGTYVTVSAFQRGISSSSCGPILPLPQHKVMLKEGQSVTFSFIIG